MNAIFQRVSLFAGLMLVLTGAAYAVQPAPDGLGQSWPNTTDVSSNPNFHAYVFKRSGIKYIQVNDINGNILGAVGTQNGVFITLPVGQFAAEVSTPEATASTTAMASGTSSMIYRDKTTTVTATPLSDGTIQLTAANAGNAAPTLAMAVKTKTDPTCDPIECASKNIVADSTAQAVAMATKTSPTCDPIECASKNIVTVRTA